MPERLTLYNNIKDGYDLQCFNSYMLFITITKILSFSVKEEAVEYFNSLNNNLKEKIRCLQ